MSYSSFTNEELVRALVSPMDPAELHKEIASRFPALVRRESEDVRELTRQLEISELKRDELIAIIAAEG